VVQIVVLAGFPKTASVRGFALHYSKSKGMQIVTKQELPLTKRTKVKTSI